MTIAALLLGSAAPAGVRAEAGNSPPASLEEKAPAQAGDLPTSPAERPNFLFILVDDLGPEWLSCYGSEHKTPRIDRLAETGIRFQTVYATPLCTPTRHELLTGRYPFRTGWTVHHDTPRWGGQYFDWRREVTFARVLRDAGYATAIAGKWQINDLRTHPDALKEHGFDEHCVWPGFESDNPPAAERYFDPFVQTSGKRATLEGRFGPDVFNEFMIDFIRRNKERPFLAYYAMVLTHTPFTKTPHNKDTTAEKIALHPGMVNYVDYLTGRLVDTLDELKLRERTVILFTCDNGTVMGVKGRMNGRLVNGGKGTLTEAGIRVPLIVNWPGRTPAGRVSDELVDFTDFFPTLLEMAGVKPPEGVTLDGRSFAGLLTGRPDAHPPREWIYSQLGTNRVVRDKRYKLYSDGRLYDAEADPDERVDLAASEDPAAVAARRKLGSVLKSLPKDAKLPFAPARKKSGQR